jgi:predicted RNA binding protein YcfA (HicA-like mRNA interferase family)
MKVRDVIKRIEQDGWRLDRQRGSHRIYRHPSKAGTVTVAGRRSADLPPGTLGSVLVQAGLKKRSKP